MSFPTMLSFSSSSTFSSSSSALKKTNTNGSRKRRGKRRIDVDVRSKSSSSSGNLFQGKKRSKAKLPGYAFYVSPEDFSSTKEGDERLPEHIEAVVKKGATMVVLHDPTSSLSTREFYNLAVNIKTNLRERCALLVVDRTDIVSSAEIDGVVLSTDGVPTVVARKSMPEGSLVVVSAGENAKNAEIAAKEGCDVLIVSDASVAKKIRDNVSVPIFSSFRDAADLTSNIDTIVAAECDGVTLYENANKKDAAIADTIGAALSALGGDGGEEKNFLNKEETTERKSAIPPTQFTSVIGEQGLSLIHI